jgi:hypothetical protein
MFRWLAAKLTFTTVKDVIGFGISVAAFAISVSALYAAHRKIDRLGVVIASAVPLIDVHKDGEFTVVVNSSTATFVNTGTRDAAVLGARLLVEQPNEATWRACEHSASTSFEFSIEPFVVKPAEIVAKVMVLQAKMPVTIPTRGETPVGLLCLEFDVSTPDQLYLNLVHQYLAGTWPLENGERNMKPFGWLPGKITPLIDE